MKKKFTDATVTMTLNDYNEMLERVTLLESAVTVSRPSWTKGYIEVRFDCQLVESFIMEKFFSLPYFEEYELRDHELYAASTTMADLRKPEEEPSPTNEATAPEELSWNDPAAHVELEEELEHFIPAQDVPYRRAPLMDSFDRMIGQHVRPMGVTDLKEAQKNETI